MAVGGDHEHQWADWYAEGDANIQQGDILPAFPVVTPTALDPDGSYTFAKRTQSLIILTQTCDIPKPKQRTLMAASVESYESLVATGKFDYLRSSEYRKSLAHGTAVADFLLPPTPGAELSWSIVHFREVFVVPKAAVATVVAQGAPIRLASPYKEYLSQSFARFVMRVGLPSPASGFLEWHPKP